MCIIQAVMFMKNGSNLSSPCTAILTNRIEADIVFTATNAEAGTPVYGKIAIKVPDGTTRWFFSSNFSMVTGSNDAIITIPVSTWGIGTYQIINAWIEDVDRGAPRCEGIPNVGYCQSLTVSTPTTEPPPSLKWKCSGSPNYICSQASDGIYNNKVDCESICKTGATDKKSEIGNTILIVLGAGVGLGVLYYITQKKK